MPKSSEAETIRVYSVGRPGLPFERVVGVPLKSYVSLSWTYYFRKWPGRRIAEIISR